MRLKSIKLAGFKSFVEPTTVSFPGNLCAIVGPNGCGKSNIIDAVRWVMGESSAVKLRGEALTDVIFSGSGGRKPTTQASIELLFDNSDGRIGGQYAEYAEIAVRRQVTRDGQSTYFLNGTRCRRRDITDVFLGTGFGPRSYSIIEQGMVSQLVAARPDELRGYLEEAAGISRYKERRRETENRIRHTRENLERLNDLREELDRQLTHLQRQARAAERYRELKAEESAVRAELLTLRWRDLGTAIEGARRVASERENTLARREAERQQVLTAIEARRAEHGEAVDHLAEVQRRFYEAGAAIARLEQIIAARRERIARLGEDVADTEAQLERLAEQADADSGAIDEIDAASAALTPRLEQAAREDAESAAALQRAEAELDEWRSQWEALNDRFSAAHREEEVEHHRAEHLEQLVQRLEARLSVLDGERGTSDTEGLGGRVAELRRAIEQEEQRMAEVQARSEAAAQRRDALRPRQQAAEARREALRARLEALRQEQASVQAEQRLALGRVDDAAAQWLEAEGLGDAPRLGELLHVEPGWERGVETVLDAWLKAAVATVDVDRLQRIGDDRIELLSPQADGPSPPASDDALANNIRCEVPVGDLLAGVRCAPDLPSAWARRGELRAGESWVTPEGAWLGRNWLRLGGAERTRSGVIARTRRLEALDGEITATRNDLQAAIAELEQLAAQAAQADGDREAAQQGLAGHAERLAELRADIGRFEVRLQEAEARRARADEEYAELAAQCAEERARLAECRERHAGARAVRESLGRERDGHAGARQSLVARVENARRVRDAARAELGAAELERQRLEARRASLLDARQRLEEQRSHARQRRAQLAAALLAERQPVDAEQADLQRQLDARGAIEAELRAARQALEAVEQQLSELERTRDTAEQAVAAAREACAEQRLALRDLEVRRDGLVAQLREQQADPEAVSERLSDQASEAEWNERLQSLDKRISRLGAINLAAIDEFEAASERKVYLDTQGEDLAAALETLESAIRRIDRETRSRFRATFDAVNGNFRELFPKLFGGGDAYMELTGEDVLDAGITLMARPPGKRNAHIQMLSGGEKALTALALVFAIFHLNPSPVCLLDEVDAPLDDVNVGRFAALIRDMSQEVQFVFITHNKLTMEIADQLCGVTMAEPGVSRLVTVDIEEAAAMAAL